MACSDTYFVIFRIMNSSHRTPCGFHVATDLIDGCRDRSGKKDAKNLKLTSRFTSLREALKWQWNFKAKREAKEINPHLILTLLGKRFLHRLARRMRVHASLPDLH